MADDHVVPVVGVRLAEGRSGSTLLMQLLATSPQIVFDDRYPSENRYLSYFARLATMMTEPFDERRHVGVTPFFFGGEHRWGPIPFRSDVLDTTSLEGPLLKHMWSAWSEIARSRHPDVAWYAEKLAIGVDQINEAGIPLRVIDLVRDPRDVLASIRAFTASGVDGFGRKPGMDEDVYRQQFIDTMASGLDRMRATRPRGVERMLVRYEDLVTDLRGEAERLGAWLQVELAPDVVEANRPDYEHHTSSASPIESIGRWRDDLSDEDEDAVADGLREVAAHFGYDL